MESLSKSAVRIKLETAGRGEGGGEGKERKKKLRKQRRQQQLCQFYNGERIIIVTLTFQSLFSASLVLIRSL